MRLIDADKAVEEFCGYCTLDPKKCGGECSFLSFLNRQDTVNPARYGHWEKWSGAMPPEYMGKHHCSLCGGRAPYDSGFRERLTGWCPGCGAKMEEKDD